MDITGHFKTVTQHRNLVMLHCFKCGIPFRGLVHDLSKYSPAEFFPSAFFYEKGKRSPNEHQREVMGYSSAWLHHKGRNRHHYEYWYDVNPETKTYEPVPIPVEFLKESFCDRVAASKIYRGADYCDSDPLEYLNSRPAEQLMHPCTACILRSWLKMLSEKGEKATFAHIRRVNDIKYCTDRCKKYNTK